MKNKSIKNLMLVEFGKLEFSYKVKEVVKEIEFDKDILEFISDEEYCVFEVNCYKEVDSIKEELLLVIVIEDESILYLLLDSKDYLEVECIRI